VAVIKPFRALRPTKKYAEQVSCVPYDVVDDAEVREMIGENPLSFLRVTRPEADFPVGEIPSVEQIFEKARENLQRFIDDKVLVQEDDPGIYLYRLSTGTQTQTGVVACCSVDEYEAGLIKKHEKTRPDKVEDRTAHMVSLHAQTGLIFLTFRGSDETRKLIADAVEKELLYDFDCTTTGVHQTIWSVENPEDFIKAFEEVPALYVADGHHRVESANLARKQLRDQNSNHTGDEQYNYVIAGIFPKEDLKILAYNRIVKDLNGLKDEEFLAELSPSFIVTETDVKEPTQHADICMYLSGKWYRLRFNVQFIREPDLIDRLEASILEQYVLKPILGIDDVRTDKRIGFVGGIRGTKELEKLVDSGAEKVAFSMFPTTMDDLLAVSDLGEIMPPKSTWFEPKLKDGLLVHLI
jgi:uncharacterized protein (DUF1015 family)